MYHQSTEILYNVVTQESRDFIAKRASMIPKTGKSKYKCSMRLKVSKVAYVTSTYILLGKEYQNDYLWIQQCWGGAYILVHRI